MSETRIIKSCLHGACHTLKEDSEAVEIESAATGKVAGKACALGINLMEVLADERNVGRAVLRSIAIY